MFDIGFWEILLILLLALVVLGPERLPQVARSVGYWVGKARRYVEGVKEQVESEFDTTEFKRLLHNQEVQIKELQDKIDESGGGLQEKIVDTSLLDKVDDAARSIDDGYTNELDMADEPEVHHEPQYEILEEDDDDDGGIGEVSESDSKKTESSSTEKTE